MKSGAVILLGGTAFLLFTPQGQKILQGLGLTLPETPPSLSGPSIAVLPAATLPIMPPMPPETTELVPPLEPPGITTVRDYASQAATAANAGLRAADIAAGLERDTDKFRETARAAVQSGKAAMTATRAAIIKGFSVKATEALRATGEWATTCRIAAESAASTRDSIKSAVATAVNQARIAREAASRIRSAALAISATAKSVRPPGIDSSSAVPSFDEVAAGALFHQANDNAGLVANAIQKATRSLTRADRYVEAAMKHAAGAAGYVTKAAGYIARYGKEV